MDGPKPTQIPHIPVNGEMTYLFRKTLTYTDIMMGLVLTKKATSYFEALSNRLPDLIARGAGQRVAIYTPRAVGHVFIRRFRKERPSFHLEKFEWSNDEDGIATLNGFCIGDKIDCWCVDNCEDPVVISLFIQKADSETNWQQDEESEGEIEFTSSSN